MSAIKLRQQLMEGASPILEAIMAKARGEFVDARIDQKAQTQVWDLLVPLITAADDPAPLAKLSDGSIENKVDLILEQVAIGKLPPNRAKDLMGLLQAGYGDMSRETLDTAKQFVVNIHPDAVKKPKSKSKTTTKQK